MPLAPRLSYKTIHLERLPLLAALLLLALLLAACAAPLGSGAGASAAAQPTATAVPMGATDESFNGLPVGFTDEGWPFRGNPLAPLTMYVYSDFQCPFCSRHFVQTEPAINERWVQDGRLRVIFRDMPLTGLHPNAPAAHESAACAGEQSAARFWDMHNKLFESQAEWSNLADPQPVFARLAGEVGADVVAWQSCVDGNSTLPALQAGLDAAAALGFDGTPSFQLVGNDGLTYSIIGAQPFASFESAIEDLLAGKTPNGPRAESDPSQGIPFWASAEGMAVDPDNPGRTVAGDHTRGSADAPVVVIEFSDFQCPYCRKHHEGTQAALDAQFVDAGQVRWVYKHFPLPSHAQAPAAGVAAECAGQQGRFWEMGDALFAGVDDWSVADPDPVFIELAAGLDLDTDAFAACLLDPDIAALVDADVAAGAAYVQGTPTFIVRAGNHGRIIPGALPEATFIEQLQMVLDEAEGA